LDELNADLNVDSNDEDDDSSKGKNSIEIDAYKEDQNESESDVSIISDLSDDEVEIEEELMKNSPIQTKGSLKEVIRRKSKYEDIQEELEDDEEK
jgi:hypothetical protein